MYLLSKNYLKIIKYLLIYFKKTYSKSTFLVNDYWLQIKDKNWKDTIHKISKTISTRVNYLMYVYPLLLMFYSLYKLKL